MKKSKLLTLISTLSITGISLPAISSCANSQQINTTSDNKTQTTNSTQNNTQSWTVTFDKGDGTSISGTTKFVVKDKRKFGSIDKPTITKPNYTQTGWKDTLTNSQVYDYTKITANMNIVPIFEQDPKYYTVSLFAGSGYFKDTQGNKTKIQQFNVLENTTIKEALGSLTIENEDVDIEYDGNWTDGSETYDESKEITSDLVLTVKYESAWAPTLSETYKDAIGIKVKSSGSLKLVNTGENAPELQIYRNAETGWEDIGGSSPTEVSLSAGDIVYLKSNQSSGWSTSIGDYSTISITAECNISGSVMGLLNNGGEDTSVSTTEIPGYGCFCYLFKNSNIKKIYSNFLPATTLGWWCYKGMFSNCTGLTTLPSDLLPATTLASDCYNSMFYGCNQLTTIPEGLLPATTLASSCYEYMFSGCTGLTSLPENLLSATTELANYSYEGMFSGCTGITSIPSDLLPASTLAKGCYESMFYGCTGIISIPNNFLPATTLAASCYYQMFQNCTGLTTLPEDLLLATTLAAFCYRYMFMGCTRLSTLPENLLPATTLASECYSGMFSSCTGLTTLPSDLLPAETLASSCYVSMFSGCKGLTTLPENLLPATTLEHNCYGYMFLGCTGLITLPENLLSATTLATYCYYEMFANCKSLASIPNLPATTLAESCYERMFYDCTLLKINENGTGTKIFECPSYGEEIEDPVTDMFTGTGGTFTGTPTAGNTYYYY